ncbi:hypothetical protein EPYR_02907 [Erwinia pyrifoliae DSM 12163]|nr:hypothetical protein EPYR_02907 [Erwinia pyrifoliae DSM 12163]
MRHSDTAVERDRHQAGSSAADLSFSLSVQQIDTGFMLPAYLFL